MGRPQPHICLAKGQKYHQSSLVASTFFSARGGKAGTPPSPLAVSEHKSVVKVVTADVINSASKQFGVIPRP